MKVYLTGYNHRKITSRPSKYPITLHFFEDCQLLNGTNTGKIEYDFPIDIMLEKALDPFVMDNREYICCSQCIPAKFKHHYTEYIFRGAKEQELKRMQERATELAKRRLGEL